MRYFTLLILVFVAVSCGKKKEKTADAAQPRIAYAVYGVGIFDQIGQTKASEYLNRGEMLTVLDTVEAPSAKPNTKGKLWAKVERTTGKKGFVEMANLADKVFVVVRPLEVFNINQAAGKRLATVPIGQIGFIVDEKAGWAKIRFGYSVSEDWSFSKESTKWLENKWAQIEGVSYEPAAIGQGVELETALRKLANTDAAKKEAGKKELEAIIHEERSQFLEVARKILAEKTKPETETPQPQSESKSSESHDAHKGEEHGNP